MTLSLHFTAWLWTSLTEQKLMGHRMMTCSLLQTQYLRHIADSHQYSNMELQHLVDRQKTNQKLF